MKYITLILIVLLAFDALSQSSSISDSNPKTLKLIDIAYEPQIKTILLHPSFGGNQDNLLPAVTPLGQWNLLLEFDDLVDQRESYYARIVHCNYNWTKSDLMDLDFIKDYNEFPINNFEFSVDTHIPYIHYWFTLPAVKLPGNYLVVVYRSGDRNDIVLSRRFMVYDSRVSFENDANLINSGRVAQVNQQINFTIDYQTIDFINPLDNVKVDIRQNQRWDNMEEDVRPSFLRENQKQIEYRFFDESKMFIGGNEFRFFDLRSINYPGRNIGYVNKIVKPYEAYIANDKSRSGDFYSIYQDYDGGFIIENLDYNDLSFTNYVYVNFSLASPEVNGKVYVTGAFNYWNLNEDNEMKYDATRGEYQGRLLLKQGWYDYQYILKSAQEQYDYFEGSHFETENSYEILVYYRPFQPRADLLIGYLRVKKNPR